jgi:hypothetical protein
MTSSQFVQKLAIVVTATLMATAAVAEDMSLPGPSSDCLSKARVQLSLDNAQCAGSYPVTTQLYGECITSAQRAYAGAIAWCTYVGGGKVSALRGTEAIKGKLGSLKRL